MSIGIVEDQIRAEGEATQIDFLYLVLQRPRLFVDDTAPVAQLHVQKILGSRSMPGQKHGTHQKAARGKVFADVMEGPGRVTKSMNK